jgi:hypothetical protein
LHSGVNVDDRALLEGLTGFSVARDGRLRFDCGLYAQLARSDLQGIPGIRFSYVVLKKDGAGEVLGGQGRPTYRNASLQCYDRRGCLNVIHKEQIPSFRRNEADLGGRYERFALYVKRTFTEDPIIGMRQLRDVSLRRVRTGMGQPGPGWEYLGQEIVAYDPSSWIYDKFPPFEPTASPAPEGFVRGAIDLFRTGRGKFDHVKVEHGQAYPAPSPVRPEEEERLTTQLHEAVYRLFLPAGDRPHNPYAPPSDPHQIAFETPSPTATDETGAHMIGIVSIGSGHLVIDNHLVEYVETDDIWSWVKTRYGSQYENFSRRPTYRDEGNTVPF